VEFAPADAQETAVGAACGQYLGGGRDEPLRPRRTLHRA